MKYFFAMIFLVCCHTIEAQQKEQMKNENIKTQTLWKEVYKGKKVQKYQYQELRFNRKGHITEEVIFNIRGKIVFHRAYTYDNDLLINEIELDSKGRIIRRAEYRYIGKLLVEKKIFDGRGNLVEKEDYIFEYQD